jgi:hypothetical protein
MNRLVAALFKIYMEGVHYLFIALLILLPVLYILNPSVHELLRSWGINGGWLLFIFLLTISVIWIIVFGLLSTFISINENLKDIKHLLQHEAKLKARIENETALVMSDSVLDKPGASYKEPYFKK